MLSSFIRKMYVLKTILRKEMSNGEGKDYNR